MNTERIGYILAIFYDQNYISDLFLLKGGISMKEIKNLIQAEYIERVGTDALGNALYAISSIGKEAYKSISRQVEK